MNELDRKGPMTEVTAAQSRNLHVGIDIGSTTVKAVVLDADTNEELFGVYRRHGSEQIQATLRVLDEGELHYRAWRARREDGFLPPR